MGLSAQTRRETNRLYSSAFPLLSILVNPSGANYTGVANLTSLSSSMTFVGTPSRMSLMIAFLSSTILTKKFFCFFFFIKASLSAKVCISNHTSKYTFPQYIQKNSKKLPLTGSFCAGLLTYIELF